MNVIPALIWWSTLMFGAGWCDLKVSVYLKTGCVPTWKKLIP